MSDNISTRLATNLKRLRTQKGWSQQALADESGVPRPTLAHLESGAANPTLSVVSRVAKCLGVSLDGLLEEDGAGVRVLDVSELRTERRRNTKVTRLVPEGVGRDVFFERIVAKNGGRWDVRVPDGMVDVLACERGQVAISNAEREVTLGSERVALVRGAAECCFPGGGVVYRLGGLASSG